MIALNGEDILSQNQVGQIDNIVEAIINALPGQALNQLLEGYSNDVDKMLMEI